MAMQLHRKPSQEFGESTKGGFNVAQRRMFSLAVCDTDRFLELPVSTQLLYFHFGLRADDDGFVSSPKRILRTVGCAKDDLRLLITKNFVIPFESGVVVIADWEINNFIRTDRYHETIYLSEKALICKAETGRYQRENTSGIPSGNQLSYQMEPEVRLGKDSLGEVSNTADKPPKHKKFVPPSVEEIKAYCVGRKNSVDAERFADFYTSKGWLIGKSAMKDWRAAIRTWEKNTDQREPSEVVPPQRFIQTGTDEFGDPIGQWEAIP